MQNTIKKIAGIGVVPLLRTQEKDEVIQIAGILKKQSLPLIEIALRSSNSLELVKTVKEKVSGLMIGVSNILTVEQIDLAKEAGCDYITTVSVNTVLIEKGTAMGIPVIPECTSSQDLDHAKSLGVECVKLISGTPLCDWKVISELSERYKGMKFIITEGVHPEEFNSYLKNSSVIACCLAEGVHEKGSSSINYEQLEGSVSKLVEELLGVELVHVGVNASHEGANDVTDEFCHLLNEEKRETPISIFAGNTVEVMKGEGRGLHGHIGYGVNHVERAMCYFESRGYHFVPETFKYNEKGEITFAYFKEEIGGFAIHIIQK